MALAIRLKRMGRKKKPFYRVVVIDERNPRQGKAVDDLGYYDPMVDPARIEINVEKSLVWLGNGARPTDTARSLLSKAGVLKIFHEQKYPKKTETVEQPDEEVVEQPDEEVADQPDSETVDQPDSEQEEP